MRSLHLMAGMSLALAACLSPSDGSGGGSAEASEMAHKSITISGETFEIAVPYAEGHTLNAAEASVLNQTFLENIRNNANGKIKAAKEAAETAGTTFSLDTPVGGEGENASKTLRQLITEYAQSYEFGVRTARTAEPVDPVEREARAIARDLITTQLKAQGVKRKDVPDEVFEEALKLHSANSEIVKEAQRRVKMRASIGLGELDLSALAPAAVAATES